MFLCRKLFAILLYIFLINCSIDSPITSVVAKIHKRLLVSETPRIFTGKDRRFSLKDYPPLPEFLMRTPPMPTSKQLLESFSLCNDAVLGDLRYQSVAHSSRAFYGCNVNEFWNEYNEFVGYSPATSAEPQAAHRTSSRSENIPKISRQEELLGCQYSANFQACFGGDMLAGCLVATFDSMPEAEQTKELKKELENVVYRMCSEYSEKDAECSLRVQEYMKSDWPIPDGNCRHVGVDSSKKIELSEV